MQRQLGWQDALAFERNYLKHNQYSSIQHSTVLAKRLDATASDHARITGNGQMQRQLGWQNALSARCLPVPPPRLHNRTI
ncbi:hypothetical protein PAXRUDRAFT_835229 [Paxillus rubicundulus Ve08.2h10]|uniref:Uncharacterized protein n=1 Tax=Paxillus rubicundulus Ve08.2h10 TaxID=930991 RepID=A0A0D0CZQ0_9AGAM|nr:hypothetical protein PAXRUDRAFT_835229 [Paxillus rubicundulus Ve08.2h10]